MIAFFITQKKKKNDTPHLPTCQPNVNHTKLFKQCLAKITFHHRKYIMSLYSLLLLFFPHSMWQHLVCNILHNSNFSFLCCAFRLCSLQCFFFFITSPYNINNWTLNTQMSIPEDTRCACSCSSPKFSSSLPCTVFFFFFCFIFFFFFRLTPYAFFFFW